ncbi:MAG: ribosome recycling factor [Candidatus Woesebacteria bacterium]|jgi:ribosome recycling factor
MLDESLVDSKMQEVLDLVVSDIGTVRTGRATPALIEDLEVTVYGGQQTLKINELANISSTDPETIVIEPWDKSVVGEIAKGIQAANIGMTPNIDGEIIRINLPPLTTEDREKYVKLLSTKLENGRIMIRQIRTEAMREIKKSFEEGDLSEDEKFNQEKRLQEITDKYIDRIEKAGESKKKELLQV